MRVKLSSIVISSQVEQYLVEETSNLDIVGSLDVLNAPESTGRNEAGAMATLGAPGDFLALGVADRRVRLGRGP